MSKWNTSYIPSTEDVVAPPSPRPCNCWRSGPAGAAVLVALLVSTTLRDEQGGWLRDHLHGRIVVWILLSMVAVGRAQSPQHALKKILA